jgi:CHAT domain-containing protein
MICLPFLFAVKMRRGLCWLTVGLSILSSTAFAENRNLATRDVLVRAQRQIDLGVLKSTAGLLQQQIALCEGADAASSDILRLSLLLADVYYRSQQYDKAMAVARKSKEHLTQFGSKLSRDEYDYFQRSSTVVFAKSCIAFRRSVTIGMPNGQGEEDHRLAIHMLSEVSRSDGRTAFSLMQLELFVLRAQLVEGETGHDKEQQAAERLWRDAEQYARAFSTSAGTIELRASIALLRAKCLAALRSYGQAADQLQEVAEKLGDRHPLQRDLWLEIASNNGLAGKNEVEVKDWRKVVALDASGLEHKTNRDWLGQASGHVIEAEHRRRLAWSLQKCGLMVEHREQLNQSLALNHRALDLTDLAEKESCDADETRAIRIAALQGIVDAARDRFIAHDERPENWEADALTDARRLHDLLMETLLPGDPRIISLDVDLAAQYVRLGDFDEAGRFVNVVRASCQESQMVDSSMRVRFLLLDSEFNRMKGRIQDAQASLDRANQVYQKSCLTDEELRLTIDLNCARLHMATGQYGQAERELDDVVQRAKEVSPSVEEVWCLASLNKALLCKSLSRFAEAEDLCHAVLRKRQAELGHETRELLPYYSAMIAIQLDAGKLEDAQDTVDRAQAICEKYRLKDTLPETQVRHHQALIHFGRYQATHAAKEADIAACIWEGLLPLQTEHHWPIERIHTLYFSSRLKFLQWQHGIQQRFLDDRREQSDNYRRLQLAYEGQATLFQQQLTAHQQDRVQYEQSLKVYANRLTHTDNRDREYRDLLDWYTRLKDSEMRLQKRRTQLAAEQKHVQAAYDAYLKGAASPVKRHSADSSPPGLNDPILAAADKMSDQAVRLSAEMRVYPNLQYVALCNRAAILRAQGGAATISAMQCLREAVDLIERPRTELSTNDIVRSGYFARYAAAFDLLVAWSVEDRRPESALQCSELCRNRSFLDRIRSDGVRLIDSVAEKDLSVVKEEESLLAQYATISAELAAINEISPSARVATTEQRKPALQASLDDIDRKFSKNRRNICQLSLVYQNTLGKPLAEDEVLGAISRFLASGELGLYYHIGASGGFAFLLGAKAGAIEVFPLELPNLDVASNHNVLPSHIKQWVEKYREAVRNRHLASSDNARLRSELERITRGLLPSSLLDRLRELQKVGHSHLVIFPDNCLYDFPFEALLVESTPSPRYLTDELNAMSFAYAPSIMIGDALRGRVSVSESASPCAISLGYPDFSRLDSNSGPLAHYYLRDVSGVTSVVELPSSKEESDAVVQTLLAKGTLDRSRVTQLLGKKATEGNLCGEITRVQPTFLHIATHGIATDNSAALLMALPGERQVKHTDDGFLELYEIYGLPLGHCELAVVSACNGNIGGKVPMEMSATLSRAFLSAGARRVVASLWPVSDRATAKLMKRFFEEIAGSIQKHEPVDYGIALRNARNHLRQCEGGRWSEPYYWAPFILLGPAN